MAINVFCCCADEDEKSLDQLTNHLEAMKREGLISDYWHPCLVMPGQHRHKEVTEHLRTADLVLLLLSADFMASDVCAELQAQALGQARTTVVPVLLRPVKYDPDKVQFRGLQTLPRNGKPVLSWKTKDEAWFEVMKELRGAIEGRRSTRPRVFISYKRNGEPDHRLAETLLERLGAVCDVRIDQQMNIGVEWVRWIHNEIRAADYLVLLLSSSALRSEMIPTEIEVARAAHRKHGRPIILPIRVRYTAPYPPPLDGLLRDIQWTSWNYERDTDPLVDEILRCVRGEGALRIATGAPASEGAAIPRRHPVPHAEFGPPGGAMEPVSPFYIERDQDAFARRLAEQSRPFTLTIKGPRQVGKSSLLAQVVHAARKAGRHALVVDFQVLDSIASGVADQFFREFFTIASEELGIENRVQEFWGSAMGNPARGTSYMMRHVLPALGKPLLLALDEVERLFGADFRSSFFGMLRSWHNSRAYDPIWKSLSIACVTSTEPHLLISRSDQSPFNVGEVVEPADFTLDQVHELNRRHGDPVDGRGLQRLFDLLGGQPFLTRRALYLLAEERQTLARLEEEAAHDMGPFGDHLRHLLIMVASDERVCQAFRGLLNGRRDIEPALAGRLSAAGLVAPDRDRGLRLRCRLYRLYFEGHLRG